MRLTKSQELPGKGPIPPLYACSDFLGCLHGDLRIFSAQVAPLP